jgi:hypothetical protein
MKRLTIPGTALVFVPLFNYFEAGRRVEALGVGMTREALRH